MTSLRLALAPGPDDPTPRVRWDVSVAGTSQRLRLDTGAARTIVTACAGLGAAPEGTAAELRRSDDLTLATASILTVAGVELARDLVVAVAPPGSSGEPVLGADALQDHSVHLRFCAGECVLDGPQPEGFLLELERPGVQPFVEVRAGGMHTRARLDTGAGATLVDLAFARRHPDVFEVTDTPAAGSDAGRGTSGVVATMAPVRIGGALFPAQDVVAADLSGESGPWPLTLVLGLPLIGAADWYLDFPGNAWAITRRPA